MLFSKIPEHESSFDTNKKDISGNLFSFTEDTLGDLAITKLASTQTSNYFYAEDTTKKSIAIHFTAGYIKGDVAALTKKDNHVSVAYLIARSGKVYNFFDPKKWSYHLGSGAVGGNTIGSKQSIAIEISNIGPLVLNGSQLDTTYKVGDKYCDLSDKDAYIKLDEPFRGYSYFSSFTQEQYDSLRILIDELCDKFDIPKEFIKEENRFSVFSSKSEANEFQGICTHVNYRSSGKWDIGPAFEWAQITGPKVTIPATPAWQFPIKLTKDTLLNKENLDAYYKHSESESPGGYFPIALNSTWHGGVHLYPSAGADVFAMAPGKIIAARLISGEDLKYGSRNFILMEHTHQEETWYSLYYHLAGFNASSKFDWLLQKEFKLKQETTWYKEDGSLMEKALSANTTVKVIEKREEDWYRISYQNKTAFAQLTADKFTATQTEIAFESALHGTQNFDIYVPAGTLLGKCGFTKKLEGDEFKQIDCLHWQVFSGNPLAGRWQQVKDEMPQVQCKNEMITKLIDRASIDDDGIFRKDSNLTAEEIKNFYSSEKSKFIRNFAVRFYSEWAMDWQSQKEALKSLNCNVKDAQLEEMQKYNFWNEISFKNWPQASVWHYNPVTWLQKQLGSNALLPLKGSLFSPNKTFLLPSHICSLKEVANYLKDAKVSEAIILGHQGVDGDTLDAVELSQKRADCVSWFLTKDKDSFVAAFQSDQWGVWEIQRCMVFFKDDQNKSLYSMKVDGISGPGTRGAIRKLQEIHSLDVDGIAGPQTYGKVFDLFWSIAGEVELSCQAKGCGREFSSKKEGVVEVFLRDGEGESFAESYLNSSQDAEIMVRTEKSLNLSSAPIYDRGAEEGDFVFYLPVDKSVGLTSDSRTSFTDQESAWQECIKKESYVLKNEKNEIVSTINGADLTIRPKEKNSVLDYWVLHFTAPPGDSFSLIHKSAPISEEENLSEYIIFEKLTREEILDFMAT